MKDIYIDSLSELKKYGYVIIDKENTLNNKLKEALIEKGLTPSDLAVLSGISKQNISDIIRSNLKPGVDLALKIAKVLNYSVEDLFELSDDAWYQIAKSDNGLTLFLDLYEMKIIDSSEKKKRISSTNAEYFLIEEYRCISKAKHDELLKNFISKNENNSLTRKELIKLFEQNVSSKRFKKLGKKICLLSSDN